MSGVVRWTAFNPLERGATNEDPLGFYAYAMRLAEEWLPGITTRTRRIRYYSMVCGGLQLIETELGGLVREAADRDAERLRLFMRWERLWVAWNAAVDGQDARGLIGRTKVTPLFRNGHFSSASLDYPFIQRQPDLGALGSYRTSLESFGLLREGVTELTVAGDRLADLFWSQDPGGRTWSASADSIRAGRIRLNRHQGRLAATGSRLGLRLWSGSHRDRDALGNELSLLKARLLPESGVAARRTAVLELLRKKRLADHEEIEILRRTAGGAARVGGGQDLERRAAAIIALEGYRGILIRALNIFRDDLVSRGGTGSPAGLMRSGDLRRVAAQARAARARLSPFLASADLMAVFTDFSMGRELDMGDGVSLLRGLLGVHQTEMVRRQTPRWFHPHGKDKWEIDPSVGYPSSRDGAVKAYSYRTPNLVNMARESGRRL